MLRNPLSLTRFKPARLSVALCCLSLGLSGCVTDDGSNPWSTQPTNSTTAQQAPLPPADQTGQMVAPVNPIPTEAKVALLLPLSGRGAETGQAMLNASQLAMFDLGATSLFELMPQDTGKGPDEAVQAALNGGANLILGPVFSDTTKRIAPIALQSGVNVVSFSTDTSAAMGSTFLLGFVPQTQVEQILDYAASRQITRIAVLAPRDTYGDSVASTFYGHMQRRGLTNGGIVRYDSKSGLSPDQISTLNGQVQAVLIATAAPESARISAQLTAQGMPPALVKRLGTGLWDDTSATRTPELHGAWYAAASPHLRERFEQRYFETYGQKPPRLASLAYDATALAVVLAKSGRGYGRDTLTNLNGFSGIDGIFRFRADGLAERGLAILEINNGTAVVVQDAPAKFVGQ